MANTKIKTMTGACVEWPLNFIYTESIYHHLYIDDQVGILVVPYAVKTHPVEMDGGVYLNEEKE